MLNEQKRGKNMKKLPNSRLGRICLHLKCLVRDRRLSWHMAGVCRELAGSRKAPNGANKSAF